MLYFLLEFLQLPRVVFFLFSCSAQFLQHDYLHAANTVHEIVELSVDIVFQLLDYLKVLWDALDAPKQIFEIFAQQLLQSL